ncbi:MAG: hypothetical protein HKN18_16860 [Silicimonas sp.]|nr:hypothetical protein [Silicimonas sp.]
MTRKLILCGAAGLARILRPALAQEDRIAVLEARVAELDERPKLSLGFSGLVVESEGVALGRSQVANVWTFGVAYGLCETDIGAPTDT